MTQATRRRKTQAGNEPSLPSRAQREAAGKAARQTAPRAGHAEFGRSPGRPDPLTLLQRQATVRVPELYRLVDMARKVVGVGSVGTRAYMLLLHGDDLRDPLFLQAKEAGPSVLEEFVGPSGYANCGQRVVVGQRLMQTVSDIFLGWVRVQGLDGRTRDFYLRQLRDWKGSAEIETMRPSGMRMYGELCGWTLARAHARSGDRVAIAAYLGSGPTFERAIGAFARTYADQNEDDHQMLVEAISAGRIAAETGL